MASTKITYGKLKTIPIAAQQVAKAWDKGASDLGKACETSTDGVTAEMLKMMLMRGDYELHCVFEHLPNGGQEPRGWFVVGVSRYPLHNSLLIYAAVGPGCTTPEVIEQVKELAVRCGCSYLECGSNVDKLIEHYKTLGFVQNKTILRMEATHG